MLPQDCTPLVANEEITSLKARCFSLSDLFEGRIYLIGTLNFLSLRIAFEQLLDEVEVEVATKEPDCEVDEQLKG